MTETNKTWGLGAFTGIVLATLIFLAMGRMAAQPTVEMPRDIIQAYNMGLKDALRVNPANADLENACLDLWAQRQ
jgi:hypothetical protein